MKTITNRKITIPAFSECLKSYISGVRVSWRPMIENMSKLIITIDSCTLTSRNHSDISQLIRMEGKYIIISVSDYHEPPVILKHFLSSSLLFISE